MKVDPDSTIKDFLGLCKVYNKLTAMMESPDPENIPSSQDIQFKSKLYKLREYVKCVFA